MSLLNRLESKNPRCDVVFTAVETLQRKKQISTFCEEFIQRGKDRGGLDPKAYLNQRVGEALEYYLPQIRTVKRWKGVLPDIPLTFPGKRTSF